MVIIKIMTTTTTTTMMMMMITMIGVFFQTVKHILHATFASFQCLLFAAAAAKSRVSHKVDALKEINI
jgi:hypothetical protein